MTRAKRIGILGGSFNPAHNGHRHIALDALEALALDEVWLMVSPGNPLKDDAGDMAPFDARLRSAKRIARRSRLVASAIEARLGTRHTYETLRGVRRRYPRARFIWLMGADNLASFHRWKSWRAIARIVPIAVIARPGYDGAARTGPAWAWLRQFVRAPSQMRKWTTWRPPALVLLRFRPDPASATRIRRADPGWHLSSTPKTRRPLPVPRPSH